MGSETEEKETTHCSAAAEEAMGAMNWTRQTEEMVKSWTEAQKRIWEDWAEAARDSPGAASRLTEDWISQWRRAADTAAGHWTTTASRVPQTVVGRLLSGEEAFLQCFDLALGAFRAVAPGLDAGEGWANLLRRYIHQAKDAMSRGPSSWLPSDGAAAAARDLPELWKLYAVQLQKLWVPWAQSLRDAHGHLGEALTGDRQALVKLYNTFMDNYEATFGKYLNAPAIGYSREMNEKLLRGSEAWLDLRRANVEFEAQIVNAGLKALEELLRELVEVAERGEKITTFRQLFDLWVVSSERVYLELFSTDSFADIQGRLVNSAMRYKIQEREILDELQRALNLPTRTEIDDIHRHVHDLRDHVKALRQELADLRKSQASSAPVPAPSSSPASRPRPPRQKATAARAGAPPARNPDSD